MSVEVGEEIVFKIKTVSNKYRIDIYRVGFVELIRIIVPFIHRELLVVIIITCNHIRLCALNLDLQLLWGTRRSQSGFHPSIRSEPASGMQVII
jgi:hypothetical protein